MRIYFDERSRQVFIESVGDSRSGNVCEFDRSVRAADFQVSVHIIHFDIAVVYCTKVHRAIHRHTQRQVHRARSTTHPGTDGHNIVIFFNCQTAAVIGDEFQAAGSIRLLFVIVRGAHACLDDDIFPGSSFDRDTSADETDLKHHRATGVRERDSYLVWLRILSQSNSE